MCEILLVNAVYFSDKDSFHIGQFIIRDILKETYEVDYINFDLMNKIGKLKYSDNLEENIRIMGEYILSRKPKVVGFYTICNAFVITLLTAKYIKEKNKNIRIIFGGPHASIVYRECLENFDFIDAICIGESEKYIKILIDKMMGEEDISLVPGVASVKNGKIHYIKNQNLLTDEDLSNYTVFDFSPFTLSEESEFNIEGGRGCPFGCSFCTTSTFWGRKYRVKKLNSIFEEMDIINSMYGIKDFAIQHDMFTANRDYIIKFCKHLIENKKNYTWKCSCRIDTLDIELINYMNLSGCKSIYLGIESGSKRMQSVINKNLDLKNALDKIKYIIRNTNIKLTTSFIFCLPDETIEDFRETIKLIENLFKFGVTNIQLHKFMPLLGTADTEKIINRMYFDEKATEMTYLNINLKEIKNIIIKYPKLFSQYYTYDSAVKNKFCRFDYFIELLNTMSDFYYNTLCILLNIYSLEELYYRMDEILKKFFDIYRSIDYIDRTVDKSKYLLPKINDLIIDYLEKEEIPNESKDIYFASLYYDESKLKFFLGDKIEDVKMFKFNVQKLLKDKVYVKEDYYIKLYKIGKNVKVKHIIKKESD